MKIGNHILLGASCIYLKEIKTYNLMLTLMLMHFTISVRNKGVRFSFSIGDHELFLRFSIGIN